MCNYLPTLSHEAHERRPAGRCHPRAVAVADGLPAPLPLPKPPGSSVVTALVSGSSAPERIGHAVSRMKLVKEIP